MARGGRRRTPRSPRRSAGAKGCRAPMSRRASRRSRLDSAGENDLRHEIVAQSLVQREQCGSRREPSRVGRRAAVRPREVRRAIARVDDAAPSCVRGSGRPSRYERRASPRRARAPEARARARGRGTAVRRRQSPASAICIERHRIVERESARRGAPQPRRGALRCPALRPGRGRARGCRCPWRRVSSTSHATSGSTSSPTSRAASTSIRRGSSSSASPARASRYAVLPPTLIAENAGGTCSCSPTSEATIAAAAKGSVASSGTGAVSDDPTLGVVGVGGRAEDDAREIGLLGGGEVRCEPRGGAHEHHEHAGGHRVEGAGVADALLAERAAHAVHDVVAGEAFGLVHDEDAGKATLAALGAHADLAPGGVAGRVLVAARQQREQLGEEGFLGAVST